VICGLDDLLADFIGVIFPLRYFSHSLRYRLSKSFSIRCKRSWPPVRMTRIAIGIFQHSLPSLPHHGTVKARCGKIKL
jgi:hypothetical protein